MEAHPGAVEAHHGAVEAHPGAVEAHLGTSEALFDVTKAHPGGAVAHSGVCKQGVTPWSLEIQTEVLEIHVGAVECLPGDAEP